MWTIKRKEKKNPLDSSLNFEREDQQLAENHGKQNTFSSMFSQWANWTVQFVEKYSWNGIIFHFF